MQIKSNTRKFKNFDSQSDKHLAHYETFHQMNSTIESKSSTTIRMLPNFICLSYERTFVHPIKKHQNIKNRTSYRPYCSNATLILRK